MALARRLALRSAWRQNRLRFSRPPRSANVSPPRYISSRPDFLRSAIFISQRTSGVIRAGVAAGLVAGGTAVLGADQAEGEGVLGLGPGHARRRVEDGLQRRGSSGRSPGSVATPRAIRSNWSRSGRSWSTTTNCFSSSIGDLDDRREDHDEGAVLLARDELGVEGLDDLGTVQEPVEVAQDQERRAVGRGQGGERPDRGERIGGADGSVFASAA